MAAYDDLPIQRIVVVGLLSIAITIITVLGVQVLYFGMQNYVDEYKLAGSTYREGEEALADQTKRISRIGVDEDSGRITIPVDQAMKKMAVAAKESETNDKPSNPDET
ncbi:MAG: hypothetical protein ACO1RT_12695 [Planctomycetaceae bacterium]